MINRKQAVFQAIAVIVIIAVSVLAFKALQAARPELERREPEAVYPMVRTAAVSIGDVAVTIGGEGTVRPVSEIQVVSRVSGTIVDVAPGMKNGQTFAKGDLLVAIEDADYQIARVLAEAGVREAESRYAQAREDANAARMEWMRMNPEKEPPPLAARQPQLAAAEAHLQAQRANLEKARLDLARTRITAPFDGRAAGDNVSAGQFVTPGQPLGAIYAADAVEIVVPMESAALAWFDVPGYNTPDEIGAGATVSAEVAGVKMTWEGVVVRAHGKIDPHTRMISVVIRVEDPFATHPPLIAGQFAAVRIQGATIAGAAVIPRAALRDADTVWVVDAEARLHVKEVAIAWKDDRGVMVNDGLAEGDRVVVSTLKSVADGMRVRPVDAESRP